MVMKCSIRSGVVATFIFQEVKLCDGIEARSALMEQNLEQLQQEQEIERKEEEQHELFRRGGRSGRPAEFERR